MVRYIVWRTGSTMCKELTPGYENAPEGHSGITKWLKSRGFEHSVNGLSLNDLSKVIDWGEANLSDDFTKIGFDFLFKNKEDKVKFILRWVE